MIKTVKPRKNFEPSKAPVEDDVYRCKILRAGALMQPVPNTYQHGTTIVGFEAGYPAA